MSTPAATYYDVLQVGPEAGDADVRRAYRSLAQRFHPDKLGGRGDAVQVMAAINEAYAVLSDPERRMQYDLALTARRTPRHRSPVPLRIAAWPWWVIFGTASFTFASIATVAYHSFWAPVASPSSPVASMAPVKR